MRACAVAVTLLLAAVLALGALAWDRHGRLAAAQRDAAVHVIALEQLAGQVRTWREEADAQRRRAETAAARAAQAEQAAAARAARQLQATVPTDCPGAMAWSAAQGRDFAQRWRAR
ncbi:MAG: hypothetical protein AB1450_13295 [Pseudomonadota bacterium]